MAVLSIPTGLQDWNIQTFTQSLTSGTVLYYTVAGFLLYVVLTALRNIFLSPIKHIPGPYTAAASDYWSLWHLCGGDRYLVIQNLLEKYNSPVLRTGPNTVVIRSFEYLNKVYQTKLDKVPAYDGFRTNHGTPNSFSCVSPAEAQGKRRGMLPQYATSNLVEWQPTFDVHIGETLAYLNSLPSNRSVDILGLVAHGLIDILGDVVLDTQVRAVADFAKGQPNAIARAITFWPKRGTIKGQLHPLVWKILEYIPHPFWQEIVQSDANLAAFVDPLVLRARMQLSQGATPERPSLVHRLSTVTNSIEGGQWPASHVTSECIDHFLAGTETTSTSMAYTFYHLAHDKETMQKLQAELDENMEANTVPGIQELARWPYLNAVIKESLRHYTINPGCLDRVVPEEGIIAEGVPIPAGTHVGIQAWTTHHDPAVWEDPWKFKPERWFNETADMKKAFIPFSIGGRSCPGQNIAMFDLRLFLATIARNFDIECPPETTWASMRPFDLTTVSPRSGKCDLIFKPRSTPAQA